MAKSFCLDVSSLDEGQQTEFAETLKTAVDEFNKKLDSEESEKNDGESQETTEHHLKGIHCQCEKITVESEQDQENSEGESQEDEDE